MTKEPMSTKWCDDVHDAPQIASLRRKLRRMRRTLVAVMNTAGHIEGMVLTMVDELRKLEDKLSATIRDAAIRDAAIRDAAIRDAAIRDAAKPSS